MILALINNSWIECGNVNDFHVAASFKWGTHVVTRESDINRQIYFRWKFGICRKSHEDLHTIEFLAFETSR